MEPACGSGNFLIRVLQRKLAAVEVKFGKSDFEKRHYALLALMVRLMTLNQTRSFVRSVQQTVGGGAEIEI